MKAIFSSIKNAVALFILFSLIFPVVSVGKDVKTRAAKLSDDQKILHTLNRLGFGARPGDIERVRAVGLQNYIERQISASAKENPEIAARLRNFEVLEMTTAEIFAKYPNPGALLRMLEGGDRGGQNARRNNQTAEEMTESDRRERQRKIRELYEQYNLKPANQIILQQSLSRIVRAVYSENQLEEQMVDFWMNHFNVYAGKGAVRWYIPSYERDVIRKNALGNFKDLVTGTAQHPAMLFYLDNFQSQTPTAQANNRNSRQLERILKTGKIPPQMRANLKRRGFTDEQIEQRFEQLKQSANNPQRNQRGLNENYARELMELHTLGVDGGYTQKDIVEVAKAFTGWTIADARGYRSAAANMINERENRQLQRLQRMAGVPGDLESGEFYFNERWHDKSEKIVLGHKINEGGIKDGLKVIDVLVAHPSTAKFIARKLAVKFVSDKPSEALVQRVAQAFQKSGGDIKTTLRALFSDEEFFAPENYRAKIKTPFELLVSSLRALNADVRPHPALLGLLQKMGEPLYGYQAPTGYPDTAEDWVNTGALLERMNFAVALASNRIPQTKVDLAKFKANSGQEILNKVIGEVLSGDVSASTRTTLLKQIAQPLPEPELSDDFDNENESFMMRGNDRRGMNRRSQLAAPSGDPEVFKIVGLLLGSPDFQRQ